MGWGRGLSGLIAAAVMLMGMAACDDGGGADAGPAVDGGGGDAGPGGESVDVSFLVRDSVTLAPLAGSTVTFDAPGGDRQEAVTGADGRVTFTAVWARGEASVTWTRDTRLFSMTRITPERAAPVSNAAGDILLSSRALPPEQTVTVSGTLTNVTSATNRFNVVASARGATVYNDVGPDYSIEVPSGVPFRLFALEFTATRDSPTEVTQTFVSAQVVESAALSADATIDIDLATSLPYAETMGTIPLPTGRLDGAGVYATVTTSPSGYRELLGAAVSTAPSMSDPSVLDFTIGSYTVPGAEGILTQFVSGRATTVALVRVPGVASGAQPAFPNPPTVTDPTLGTPHPLHDAITLDGVDADMYPYFFLTDGTEERELWSILSLVAGDTEITIPPPPDASPVSSLLPASNELVGRAASCGFDADVAYCARFSVSDFVFDLMP